MLLASFFAATTTLSLHAQSLSVSFSYPLFSTAPCFFLFLLPIALCVWIGGGWCGWGDHSSDQHCRAVGSSVIKMTSVDGPSFPPSGLLTFDRGSHFYLGRVYFLVPSLLLCLSLTPASSVFLLPTSVTTVTITVTKTVLFFHQEIKMPPHTKKQIKREKGQGQREKKRKKERRTQSPKERITSKERARLRWHRFRPYKRDEILPKNL